MTYARLKLESDRGIIETERREAKKLLIMYSEVRPKLKNPMVCMSVDKRLQEIDRWKLELDTQEVELARRKAKLELLRLGTESYTDLARTNLKGP